MYLKHEGVNLFTNVQITQKCTVLGSFDQQVQKSQTGFLCTVTRKQFLVTAATHFIISVFTYQFFRVIDLGLVFLVHFLRQLLGLPDSVLDFTFLQHLFYE